MKRIKKMGPLLTTAAVLLVLSGQVAPVRAAMALPSEVATPVLVVAPVQVTERLNPDGSLTLKGVLEYSDLEGGFYTLNGWALIGDEAVFANHSGKEVEVTGTQFDGPSIRMVKQLTVSNLQLQAPAASQEVMTIEGVVEYVTVETPHYAVAGWELRGDAAQFKAVEGQQVIVRGKEFTGMSTQVNKQIDVEFLAQKLKADRPLPKVITVNGSTVRFDQGPSTLNGTLLVPLRFIVETAGGKVEWNEAERSVFVTLPDRTATFWIGTQEAEMNQNGYRYLRRNLLPLSTPPVIQGDRTMVPADAITEILGLVERVDSDGTLDLLTVH